MKIVYRPEIDGLRAVSVFAVILYHANFILFDHPLFQGGFIGVDIFFVISGYLITTLILKEILRDNYFSLKYFYERRARRILPVLLFVIIITSIMSYFILLPSSLVDFAKSVLSIASFGSNFYFWLIGGKYSEESELLKPLLHTWSLSIEEQFYILFPIFLIIIVKFFRQHLYTILSLSFVISLFLSEYFSKTHPSFNFYILLTRGFEFLIGSLLSYFKLNKSGGKVRKSYFLLNLICPTFGIILIFYSFLFFNFTKITHPSIITLIPLIGVSLIILFSKKGELITKILSNKIFVFFGLISYSLYLWHYPIFSFLRYIDVFNNSLKIKLLAIILTIILSILSYYFIEKPFRDKNIISIKKLTYICTISLFLIIFFNILFILNNGYHQRFEKFFKDFSYKTTSIDRLVDKNNSSCFAGATQTKVCFFKATNMLDREKYWNKNIKNVFIVGDSTIASLSLEIKDYFIKRNFNVTTYFTGGCALFPDNDLRCQNKAFYNYIKTINNSIIITGGRNTNGRKFDEEILYNLLKNNLIVLIYPSPEHNNINPLKKNFIYFNQNRFKKDFKFKIYKIEYKDYIKDYLLSTNYLNTLHNNKLIKIIPKDIFCNNDENTCYLNDEKRIYFYDEQSHWAIDGSKIILNEIIKKINFYFYNKN